MKALLKSAIVAALALAIVGCQMEQKPSHEKKQNGAQQAPGKEAQGMQKEAPKPSSDY